MIQKRVGEMHKPSLKGPTKSSEFKGRKSRDDSIDDAALLKAVQDRSLATVNKLLKSGKVSKDTVSAAIAKAKREIASCSADISSNIGWATSSSSPTPLDEIERVSKEKDQYEVILARLERNLQRR